jgi:hypothetical protein
MNKMIVNTLEKLFVTSDAATMLRELEVVHPAAKLLVMASHQQETEVDERRVPDENGSLKGYFSVVMRPILCWCLLASY